MERKTHLGKKKVTRVPLGAVMLLGLNINWAFGDTSTCRGAKSDREIL